MATDWLQGQINLLLEGAAEAISRYDWADVRQKAQAVLALDPENSDGIGLLAAADRAQGGAVAALTGPVSQPPAIAPPLRPGRPSPPPSPMADTRFSGFLVKAARRWFIWPTTLCWTGK